MNRSSLLSVGLLALFPLATQLAYGWDYEGHRIVNQLALSSLPTNFPAFVRTPVAAERIAFLAGEPDRWRNVPDVPLRHSADPEHYIDIEELDQYGLKAQQLTVFRYDFAAQLGLARKAHPDKFPEPEASRNKDHTRGLVGLVPWAIAENYAKLKSEFSYLKTYEQCGGTSEEIVNAQQNIIYTMGVMGHYVGDAAQPLHTTLHHHGWVGANPNHYSTNTKFHSWIDGGYFAKTGGANFKALAAKEHMAQLMQLGARPAEPEEVFQVAIAFLVEQNKLVEPLYQLEKEGKLSGEGETGLEGKAFLETQLGKAGQLLGDIWFSAWQQAPEDTFLQGHLARRQHSAAHTDTK